MLKFSEPGCHREAIGEYIWELKTKTNSTGRHTQHNTPNHRHNRSQGWDQKKTHYVKPTCIWPNLSDVLGLSGFSPTGLPKRGSTEQYRHVGLQSLSEECVFEKRGQRPMNYARQPNSKTAFCFQRTAKEITLPRRASQNDSTPGICQWKNWQDPNPHAEPHIAEAWPVMCWWWVTMARKDVNACPEAKVACRTTTIYQNKCRARPVTQDNGFWTELFKSLWRLTGLKSWWLGKYRTSIFIPLRELSGLLRCASKSCRVGPSQNPILPIPHAATAEDKDTKTTANFTNR